MTDSAPAVVEPAGNSGVGIATFAIGLVACLGQLVPVAGFLVLFLSRQYSPSQPTQTWLDISTFTSLCSCLSPGLAVFGIGLGIASLVQRGRSKKFGTIGLVLNGTVFILHFLSSLLLPVIARLLCQCPG
jgi:hypothetical protein